MKLTEIIKALDTVKHDLIKDAVATDSESTRKRSLKAALDIYRVTKKLDGVIKQLVPFEVDAITTEPAPNQLPLFKDDPKSKRTGGEPQTLKGKTDEPWTGADAIAQTASKRLA